MLFTILALLLLAAIIAPARERIADAHLELLEEDRWWSRAWCGRPTYRSVSPKRRRPAKWATSAIGLS